VINHFINPKREILTL